MVNYVNVTKLSLPTGAASGASTGAGWSRTGNYLVVGTNSAPNIYFFRRLSGNRLQLCTISGTALGTSTDARAFTDSWTGDDRMCAVAARGNTQQLVIYTNNFDGTFTRKNAADYPAQGIVQNHCAFTTDGNYLFLSLDASPWLRVLVNNGSDVFTTGTITISGAAYGARIPHIALSPDNQNIATGSTTQSMLIYAISYNGTAVTITRYTPTSIVTGANFPNTFAFFAWHPDNSHFVAGSVSQNSEAGGLFTFYKLVGDGTYTQILYPVPLAANGDTVYYATWSADGNNLLAYSRNGVLYSFAYDQATETFTLNAPLQFNGVNSGQAMSSTPNQDMIVTTGDTVTMALYAMTPRNSYLTKMADPDVMPTAACRGATWSSDNKYLIVATTSAPWLLAYKRQGGKLVALPNAFIGSTIASEARFGEFSKDGKYYAVSLQVAPGVAIFKVNGNDTFTNLTTIPALTGASNGVSFTDDSAYLTVCTTVTPFIDVWSVSADVFTKLNMTIASAPGATTLDAKINSTKTNLAAVLGTTATLLWQITAISATAITLAATTAGTPAPVGHSNGGFHITWHPAGKFFAVTSTSSGQSITVYKVSADGTQLLAPNAQPPLGDANVGARGLVWSDSGKVLYYQSGGINGQNMHTLGFDVTTELWTEMAYPDFVLNSDSYNLDISPNGKYLAQACETAPFFRWYVQGIAVADKLPNPVANYTKSAIAAGDSTALPQNTRRPPSGAGAALAGVAMSRDGLYAAVFGTSMWKFYSRVNNQYLEVQNTTTSGNGFEGDMSDDGTMCVNPRTTSPFAAIYTRSGTGRGATWTIIPNANYSALPPSTPNFAKFSKNRQYLLVGGNNYLMLYRINGDLTLTLIPLASGATAPPLFSQGGVFSPDGTMFFVTQAPNTGTTTATVVAYKIATDGSSYANMPVDFGAAPVGTARVIDAMLDMVVVGLASSTEPYQMYKVINSRLVYQPGAITGFFTNAPIEGVRFASDGIKFFGLYVGTAGIGSTIEMYQFNPLTGAFEIQAGTFDTGIGQNNTAASIAMTDDQNTILVAGNNNSPYLQMWTRNNYPNTLQLQPFKMVATAKAFSNIPIYKNNQGLCNTLPTAAIVGVSMSALGDYLAITSATSVQIFWKNSTGTWIQRGAFTVSGATQISMTKDGMYIAVSTTASPYLAIYKMAGSAGTSAWGALGTLPATVTGAAQAIKWSRTGKMLAISTSTGFQIFRKNADDTFTELTYADTSNTTIGAVWDFAFSDSERRLYVAAGGGTVASTSGVQGFAISADFGTITVMPVTAGPNVIPMSIDVAFDSVANASTIIVGSGGGDTTTNYSVWRIVGGTLTYMGSNLTRLNPSSGVIDSVKLSRDAKYFIGLNTTLGTAELWKKNKTSGIYEFLTTSFDVSPNAIGTVGAIDWSDDLSLAVAGGASTPFASFYKVTTGKNYATAQYPTFGVDYRVKTKDKFQSFSNPQSPATTPGSEPLGMKWSPDGTYLAVASATTPFLRVYKRGANNVLTPLANPTTLPPGQVRRLTWHPSGSYLIGACDTTPFLVIYSLAADVLTAQAALASPVGAASRVASISRDGKYLAVGMSAAPWIALYRIDAGIGNFTRLTLTTAMPSPPTALVNDIQFSGDGSTMVIGYSVTPFLLAYSIANDVFTKLANPATLPNAAGNTAAISHDGKSVVVGTSTTPYLNFYSLVAGVLTKQPDAASPPAGAVNDLVFSNGDRYLAMAHVNSPYFSIYYLSPGTPGKRPLPDTLPTFGTEGARVAYSPDTSLLAITGNAAPWVTVYSSDQIVGKLTLPNFGLTPNSKVQNIDPLIFLENSTSQPAVQPVTTTNSFAAFSPDGKYLVVSNFSSAATTFYKRVGNVLTKIATQPTQPTVNGTMPSWSADSRKLAIGLRAAPWVAIYANNGDDTFTLQPAFSPSVGTQVDQAALNRDGTEIAIGATTFLQLRRFDGTNWNIVTGGFDTTAGVEHNRVTYSKDDQFVAVSLNGAPWFSVYKRNPTTGNFNRLAAPAIAPSAKCGGVDISADSKRIAVGLSVSPWFYVYDFDGTTLTKRADPAVLPAGSVNDVRFNQQGNALVIAHAGSPFMSYYAIRGAAMLKRANPATMPAGATDTATWTHDGSMVVLTSSVAPYLVQYTTKNITGDFFFPQYSASPGVKFKIASRSFDLKYSAFSVDYRVHDEYVVSAAMPYQAYSLAMTAGAFPKEFPEETAWKAQSVMLVQSATESFVLSQQAAPPFAYGELKFPAYVTSFRVKQLMYVRDSVLAFQPLKLNSLVGLILVNPKDAQGNDQAPLVYPNSIFSIAVKDNSDLTAAFVYPYYTAQSRLNNDAQGRASWNYSKFKTNFKVNVGINLDLVYPKFTAEASLTTLVEADFYYGGYSINSFVGGSGLTIGYKPYRVTGRVEWITLAGRLGYGPVDYDGETVTGRASDVDIRYAPFVTTGEVQFLYGIGSWSHSAYSAQGSVEFMTLSSTVKYPAANYSGEVRVNYPINGKYSYPAFTELGSLDVPIGVLSQVLYPNLKTNGLAGGINKVAAKPIYPVFQTAIRIGGTLTSDWTLRYQKFSMAIASGKPVIVQPPSNIGYPLFGVVVTSEVYYGLDGLSPTKISVSSDADTKRSPRRLVVVTQ